MLFITTTGSASLIPTTALSRWIVAFVWHAYERLGKQGYISETMDMAFPPIKLDTVVCLRGGSSRWKGGAQIVDQ